MSTLWSNSTLWLPVSIVFLVQFFKFITESVQKGNLNWDSLARSGGMPSSHSAMVSSLATAVAYKEGMGSNLFAVAVVLAVIVVHDARGIRHESGKQAMSINRLMREVFENPTDIFEQQSVVYEELKERMGHTSVEVFMGTVVGILYVIGIYSLVAI
ncbi:MAG: divergent PAP2 family protein [Chloroflexota bacterium]